MPDHRWRHKHAIHDRDLSPNRRQGCRKSPGTYSNCALPTLHTDFSPARFKSFTIDEISAPSSAPSRSDQGSSSIPSTQSRGHIMVRGRKRDVSAPLTRSLVLQRDYRARKARYVADLEVRCQKLEKDNGLLCKEVESLKAQLRQTDTDRKVSIASLTTEAELEKTHALNNVLFALSSTTASIKSFQKLTMGPDYAPVEETPYGRKLTLAHRNSSRPSSSTTPSSFSTFNEPHMSNDTFRPLQLYSPVSDGSRSRSLSRSSSSYGGTGHENWSDVSPAFITSGLPEIEMESTQPSSTQCPPDVRGAFHLSQSRSGALMEYPNQLLSSPPLLRAPSSSNLVDDGNDCIPNFRSARSSSARNIPSFDRMLGQSISMIPPEVVPHDNHPIASYERTLSQSLRNWS